MGRLLCTFSRKRDIGCDVVTSPLGIFAAIRRGSSLLRIFAVAFNSPSAGPKAEGNDRRDRERDHSCVPQSHGETDEQIFMNEVLVTSSNV
jgi:hypothetical protein